jgi:hypothetical protein
MVKRSSSSPGVERQAAISALAANNGFRRASSDIPRPAWKLCS